MIRNIQGLMKDGTKTDIKIGLSGCKLQLIEGGLIKKISPKKSYNSRLFHQFQKQNLFYHNSISNLHTPQIYNVGDGWFDMEYIPGENYNEYFSKASKQDLDFFILGIKKYFKNVIKFQQTYTPFEVKSKLIDKLTLLYTTTQYKDFVNFIIDKVKNTKFNNIPKTFCHGDLSLTNIIFYKERLYLIDFLDSYLDTFIIDLIKLKQDLYYNWALVAHNSSLRTYQSFRYLWKEIHKEYEAYYNLEFTEIVNILNWLRIEPYLTKEKHKSALHNIIINLKYYEEFNSTNSR